MSLLLPRRYLLPLLGSAAGLVVLLGAGSAAAQQQITIGTAVDRSTPRRGGTYNPDWINYSDCINKGILTFTLTLPSPTWENDLLQVWVGSGTDCTQSSERIGTSATCSKLYSAQPSTGTSLKVKLSMQDIVGGHCDSTSSAPVKVALYFMLLQSGSTTVDVSAQYPLTYDLLGPPAPTNIKTGIAENQLKVSWTASNPATDVAGYYIFCDPKPGAASTSQPLEAGIPDAAVGTGGTDAGGGSGGATSSGGASGSTSATDAGSDAATQNPKCPSSVLITGKRPESHAFLCGQVNGATTTSGYAKGLTNGVKYNVAVAGYDAVQNDGYLSYVECSTPQVVNDFWDQYTQAGGKGGGGFCGITDRPAPGAGAAFLLALFAGIVRRRRRQRS